MASAAQRELSSMAAPTAAKSALPSRTTRSANAGVRIAPGTITGAVTAAPDAGSDVDVVARRG